MKTIVKEKTTTLNCKKIDKMLSFFTIYTSKEPSRKEIFDFQNVIANVSNKYKKYTYNGVEYINVIVPIKNKFTVSRNEIDNLYEIKVYYNLFVCEV